jgi:nucleotide-binding universal stress UspA family protein
MATQVRPIDWGFTDTARDIGDGGSNVKRILLAVSNSDSYVRAVAMVAGLARATGSEVLVVHLVERLFLGRAGYWSSETPDQANQFVSRVRDELEKLGVRVTATTDKARREVVAVRILRAAAEYRADVIVIGTRGKSTLHAFLRGSVAHELIQRSKIPVVVVP